MFTRVCGPRTTGRPCPFLSFFFVQVPETGGKKYDSFWEHEWTKHGTCTGLSQVRFLSGLFFFLWVLLVCFLFVVTAAVFVFVFCFCCFVSIRLAWYFVFVGFFFVFRILLYFVFLV